MAEPQNPQAAATTPRTPAAAAYEDPDPYVSAFAGVQVETSRDKFKRKVGENPAVPFFLGCTGMALLGGFVAFKRGNQKWSNYFQRGRVGFQGLTVLACVGGAYMGLHDDK